MDAKVIIASEKRDKLYKMEANIEARYEKEREKEAAEAKADYDTRRAVMDEKKTLYNNTKDRTETIDARLLIIDGEISAATGAAKQKLMAEKDEIEAEKAGFADLATLKSDFEGAENTFKDAEALKASQRKEAEENAKAAAFSGIETEFNDA